MTQLTLNFLKFTNCSVIRSLLENEILLALWVRALDLKSRERFEKERMSLAVSSVIASIRTILVLLFPLVDAIRAEVASTFSTLNRGVRKLKTNRANQIIGSLALCDEIRGGVLLQGEDGGELSEIRMLYLFHDSLIIKAWLRLDETHLKCNSDICK